MNYLNKQGANIFLKYTEYKWLRVGVVASIIADIATIATMVIFLLQIFCTQGLLLLDFIVIFFSNIHRKVI